MPMPIVRKLLCCAGILFLLGAPLPASGQPASQAFQDPGVPGSGDEAGPVLGLWLQGRFPPAPPGLPPGLLEEIHVRWVWRDLDPNRALPALKVLRQAPGGAILWSAPGILLMGLILSESLSQAPPSPSGPVGDFLAWDSLGPPDPRPGPPQDGSPPGAFAPPEPGGPVGALEGSLSPGSPHP